MPLLLWWALCWRFEPILATVIYHGFEDLFPSTTKLLNSLLALIVFATSLTVLNPLLVAGVLFLSLVQVIVYRKALNYQ